MVFEGGERWFGTERILEGGSVGKSQAVEVDFTQQLTV